MAVKLFSDLTASINNRRAVLQPIYAPHSSAAVSLDLSQELVQLRNLPELFRTGLPELWERSRNQPETFRAFLLALDAELQQGIEQGIKLYQEWQTHLPEKFKVTDNWRYLFESMFCFQKIREMISRYLGEAWNELFLGVDREDPNWENFEDLEELDKKFRRRPLPFRIALLIQVGFLQLPFVKDLSRTAQGILIGLITDSHIRSVLGNVRVMGEGSNENSLKFTAYRYVQQVKDLLRYLIR